MARKSKRTRKAEAAAASSVDTGQAPSAKPKKRRETRREIFDLAPLGPWARRLQNRLGIRRILWILAGLGLPALYFVWRDGFPMEENAEVPVKTVFVVVTLLLILVREFSPDERPGRAGVALALAGALAVLIYINLGQFHGHTQAHHWEQFHYTLGAKYFPELGYDGLYAASIEAQVESFPNAPLQPIIRDLRTNEMVATNAPETVEHRQEVKRRFNLERWRSFVRDNRFFLEENTPHYIYQIRRDHGFNPPPSWTFVARLFASRMPVNKGSIVGLATIDLLLLVVLFVFVFRTYGMRLGCLALVLFGVNYAGRYYWVGGAFLREDWLAAVVLGICLLERGRYRWAGALFGYATAVRIFPVLILFGPGILALRALLRRERPRWALDLGLGFALALLLALGAGSLTGRGPAAWSDFGEAIALHKDTWLSNNVGLDNVLLYDGPTYRRELVNFSLPEPWIHWQAKMDQSKHDLRILLWLAKALMLALVAAAAWRMDLARAAMLGMAVIFAMVLTTCYYWQILLLAPLLRSRWLLYGALALNLGLYVLHFQTQSFEMRYGLMSWGLLLLFVTYLAPLAWKNLRTLRPSPDGTAEASGKGGETVGTLPQAGEAAR